jgi:HlyD family secretion protein
MRLQLSSAGPRCRVSAFLLLSWPWLHGCGGAQKSATPATAPARESIVAMARLEPRGRVHRVAAAEDGVIARVLVSEGATVKAGEPIAYLAVHALREEEAHAATLKLERSGLSALEVTAQEARLRLAQAEAAYYRAQAEREKGLLESGLIGGRQLDSTGLQARRAEEAVSTAQADLDRLRQVAVLSRREAESELARARTLAERAVVRSPIDGVVLKVLAHPGERTGVTPVAQVGATAEMTAVAEVHANDIRLVTPGQRASFTSPALPAPLAGRVAQIGALIARNDVFGEDPTAPANARVFQVVVSLDDSSIAGRFTNLEGQVRIQLQATGS